MGRGFNLLSDRDLKEGEHPLPDWRDKFTGQECLILGNGPSLRGSVVKYYQSKARERGVKVLGLNQSWKLFPDPFLHITVDRSQIDRTETEPGYAPDANKQAYDWLDRQGKLLASLAFRECKPRPLGYHFRPGDAYMFPSKWSDDCQRGIVVSLEEVGTVMYVALQMAAWMGFERIYICGLDQGDWKFTFHTQEEDRGGLQREKSRTDRHDWLYSFVPERIRERITVIEPSKSTAFRKVSEWPW